MSPLHGVQPLRTRLLQHSFPLGWQVLPANLLQCGLLSPWVQQVLVGPCFSVGFPWGHSLPQAATCSAVGSSTGSRWMSAPLWTSVSCRGIFFLNCFHHWLQWNFSSGTISCSSTDMSVGSLTYFLAPFSCDCSFLLANNFFPPFLDMLSQRHYHCQWWAQLWSAVVPSWIQLALSSSDTGEVSGSFSEKPPM